MPGQVRQPGDVIGDYRLARVINEGQMTRTWEAEQISMQRLVMLEMLKSASAADEEVVRAFLEDVRAKALLTHPEVGAVYEAVSNEEGTFFSRERLEGVNLETLYQEGRKFKPLEVMALLGQIARAMIHLEENKIATVDFALHHFTLIGEDQIRLMNLAVEGSRNPAVDTRTKALLGEYFDDVLMQGLPGATRVKSLCCFMCDLDRTAPITWKQIEDLCGQVQDQLEGNDRKPPPVVTEPVYIPKESFKIPLSVWALLGGIGAVGIAILIIVTSKDPKPEPIPDGPAAVLPKVVEIPAGTYRSGKEELKIRKPFTIGRGEVSLVEYDAFLEAPDQAKYRHPDQPESKTDHLPDDWEVLWRAAVKGEKWQGRAMSIGCPVIGIDWWDAYAFANWKGGRLPTLTEWIAAAVKDGTPKGVAAWGKASEGGKDLTGAGVAGMAGNVREWTAQPEINPDTPLAPKSYVIAGASFEEPEDGINARLWGDDRGLRRSDLGFRVITKK